MLDGHAVRAATRARTRATISAINDEFLVPPRLQPRGEHTHASRVCDDMHTSQDKAKYCISQHVSSLHSLAPSPCLIQETVSVLMSASSQASSHEHTCMQLSRAMIRHAAVRIGSMPCRRPAAERPRHAAAACRGSCRAASRPGAHAVRPGSRGASQAPAERPAGRAAVPARARKAAAAAAGTWRSLQKGGGAGAAAAMRTLQAEEGRRTRARRSARARAAEQRGAHAGSCAPATKPAGSWRERVQRKPQARRVPTATRRHHTLHGLPCPAGCEMNTVAWTSHVADDSAQNGTKPGAGGLRTGTSSPGWRCCGGGRAARSPLLGRTCQVRMTGMRFDACG